MKRVIALALIFGTVFALNHHVVHYYGKSLDSYHGRLVARLGEALRAWVAKVDEIRADGRYVWIWECAAIHGAIYRGPDYGEELKAARALLASLPSPEGKP